MRTPLLLTSLAPLLLVGLLKAQGCPAETPTPASTPPPVETRRQAEPVTAAVPKGPPAPPSAGQPAAASCHTDADCAVTRVAESDCCEGCAPRAVDRAGLEAASSRQAGCRAQGKLCPAPSCAPPRFSHRVACEAGRCILHAAPLDTE